MIEGSPITLLKKKAPFLLFCCFFWGIGFACFAQQVLPEGWWLQDSPDNVLSNAQIRTFNLSYFHGKKAISLTDIDSSFEIFQQKTSEGKIERKYVNTHLFRGRPMVYTEYYLESGHYSGAQGQLIKLDFELIDDIIRNKAGTFDHPFTYQMLRPTTIGTNECIVITKVMTPSMANAVLDEKYKNLTPQQKALVGKNQVGQHTESRRDYYIRKSDGIVLGYTSRSTTGLIVDDYLCETAQVNVPIPKEEFLLPNGTIIEAHSWNEFAPAISGDILKSAAAIRTKTAPEMLWRHTIVITMMTIPSILLLTVVFRKSIWRELPKRET